MKPRIGLAVLPAVIVTSTVNAALVTATWVGPVTGNWGDSANWSRTGVPNNGVNQFDVVIDSGGAYVVSLNQNATINSLAVGIDDRLTIGNSRVLTMALGPITNNGIIEMTSSGSATELRLAADVTLDGTGMLDMTGNSQNYVRYNFGGTQRLTHGVDHTIAGGGQVGANTLYLTNHGTLDADIAAATLQIDCAAAETNFNDGLLQASNGGTLFLNGSGTFDNTGGLIRANDGSVVNIAQTAIHNGELTTLGTGVIHPSNSPSFHNLLNTGLIQHSNGQIGVYNGTITNDGSIELNSTGGSTEVRLGSTTTFTGTGSINMSDHPFNFVRYDFSANRRLINDTSHTFRGSGALGSNTLYLTNYGLIQGDQPTALQLDMADSEVNTNEGVIQATSNGTVTISNFVLDNTGGLIQALNGSAVNVNSATLSGGEISTEGTGEIHPSSSVFANLTNNGFVRTLNGTPSAYSGTIENNGMIMLDSTGGATEFRCTENVLLTGTGSLETSDHSQNYVRYNFAAAKRLTQDVDHSIHASGTLGGNTLHFDNHGLVDANKVATLTVDLADVEANTNDGVMQASDGGTMTISSCTIDNTDGVIQALDGSVVNFSNANISGGVLDSDGSGVLRPGNNAILHDVTNEGVWQQTNGTVTRIIDTITNNNRIELNSTGSTTEIRVAGTALLDGTGELVMTNNGQNYIRYAFASVTELTQGANHTIRGAGQIGVNTLNVINNGAIIVEGTIGMSIDPNAFFINNGSIDVSQDGDLSISPGALTNDGSVLVGTGRKITRSGDYDQIGGMTTAIGELEVNSGNLNLQGGVLNGDGLVDANVVNTGGSVEPGTSIATLDVEGNFTQVHGGSMTIEIESAGSYDVLAVTGVANLGGLLRLESFNGYVPQIGDSFTVLTAASRVGRFEGIIPCGTYDVTYTPTSVIVEVVGGPPVLGDLSCDGDADLQDYGFMCSQLGLTSADPDFNPQADLDNDGDVDYDDRALMDGIVMPCIGDIVTSATFQPPADLVVDGADLAFLLGQWGVGLSCADLVTSATFQPPPDGQVDGADLAVLLGAWGACP